MKNTKWRLKIFEVGLIITLFTAMATLVILKKHEAGQVKTQIEAEKQLRVRP